MCNPGTHEVIGEAHKKLSFSGVEFSEDKYV